MKQFPSEALRRLYTIHDINIIARQVIEAMTECFVNHLKTTVQFSSDMCNGKAPCRILCILCILPNLAIVQDPLDGAIVLLSGLFSCDSLTRSP